MNWMNHISQPTTTQYSNRNTKIKNRNSLHGNNSNGNNGGISGLSRLAVPDANSKFGKKRHSFTTFASPIHKTTKQDNVVYDNTELKQEQQQDDMKNASQNDGLKISQTPRVRKDSNIARIREQRKQSLAKDDLEFEMKQSEERKLKRKNSRKIFKPNLNISIDGSKSSNNASVNTNSKTSRRFGGSVSPPRLQLGGTASDGAGTKSGSRTNPVSNPHADGDGDGECGDKNVGFSDMIAHFDDRLMMDKFNISVTTDDENESENKENEISNNNNNNNNNNEFGGFTRMASTSISRGIMPNTEDIDMENIISDPQIISQMRLKKIRQRMAALDEQTQDKLDSINENENDESQNNKHNRNNDQMRQKQKSDAGDGAVDVDKASFMMMDEYYSDHNDDKESESQSVVYNDDDDDDGGGGDKKQNEIESNAIEMISK